MSPVPPYSAPGGGASGAQIDVQEFLENGVWTNPGQGRVRMELIGAGGGGGSGRRGAPGTIRCGGHGGMAGAVTIKEFDAADLPATLNVVVGQGGQPGGNVETDDTDGNAGSAGGNTTVQPYAFASGGYGGKGGKAFGDVANFGNRTTTFYEHANRINDAIRTPPRGGASAEEGFGAQGGFGPHLPGAGGAGGSITADDTAYPGASGGRGDFDGRFIAPGAGGSIDPFADGGHGGNGNQVQDPNGVQGPGSGGGGGGATVMDAPSGTGGHGGYFGGGGGGGGAVKNGQIAQRGGNGFQGFARITTIY